MLKENESFKWISLQQANNKVAFARGKVISMKGKTYKLQLSQDKMIQVDQQSCFEHSGVNDVDDMCDMTVLNEPQILNNVKSRFSKRQIFTQIGQTLLVVNPYETIPQLFTEKVLRYYKNLALSSEAVPSSPHIYLLAGKTYADLIRTNKKQTIIISGQSGAGKTQSTKFCLQLLTSLSQSSYHSIEQKILSCNPILQAFGNSKTVRNDNSSRFGKYVQIFFDQQKNITGAKIRSYLLEKSRVVELQADQRNYHCFYALIAGKLNKSSEPKNFNYLKKSNCFIAKNINDQQNFKTICESMKTVGFSENEIQRVWEILRCVLEIGNLQMDDSANQKDESKPCSIKNKDVLALVTKILGKKVEQIQKFLVYERRKFLKEYLLTPYSLAACRENMDSLSKQLYSKTFDFILQRINQKLKPQPDTNHLSQTINILDIFGFQNFEKNSFQQICINFTNEKLLNLYNKYIFEKELEILREDGLQKELGSLNFPNNDNILSLMHSRKVSLFSIVNDLTPHQQFKDIDILMGVKKQMGANHNIAFPQNAASSFVIKHSQCAVTYRIQGFKLKNKDKIKEEIVQLTQNLFHTTDKHINTKALLPPYENSSHHKESKTLLSKFTSEMDHLMSQLQTSNVHFVRCLKPNDQKKPFHVDEKFLLNQVRYLGVFETIKIRKSVFPCRKTYQEFEKHFDELFSKKTTVEQLLQKFDKNQTEFILGKKRVYLSPSLEKNLQQILQKVRKIKAQCALRILKQYKVYKFRKVVLQNVKTLKKKVKFLTKCSIKDYKQNLTIVFKKLWKNCLQLRQKQVRRKQLKLNQQQENKQRIRKDFLKRRTELINQRLPRMFQLVQQLLKSLHSRVLFQRLKSTSAQGKKSEFQKKNRPLDVIVTEEVRNSEPITNNKSLQKQENKTALIQPPTITPTNIHIQNYNSIRTSDYDSITSVVEQNQQPYYQQETVSPSSKGKKQNKIRQHKIFTFPQQFTNYNSVTRTQQTVLFRYNLKVDLFDYKSSKERLQKLKEIKKKQINNSKEKKNLVDSPYLNFKSSDLNKETYQRIISFSQEEFKEKYLRKRSNFMGKQKSFAQIFKAKRKPIQKSITKLQKQDEIYALKIFKQILKINNDGSQEFLLIIIEVFLSMIVETPRQIVNETFLQLLKQIHSDRQEEVVGVYRLILAFLHFFRPDTEFIDAGLFILFEKLQCNLYTEQEESFLRLVFQKLYNKQIKPTNTKYIPSKFQLYCLIFHKLFPFNFYLAMGSCVQFNVESDQTFAEIKSQVLQEFGINTQRFNPKYFAFFQVVTFQEGEMEEIPISDDDLVWDVKSYWEIAIGRYLEHKIAPPKFYFLLKLKFPFELHSFDYEGIQLIYSECYFDYFTGKIRVPESFLMQLGSLILKIKKISIEEMDRKFAYGIFPLWSIRKYGDFTLIQSLKDYIKKNPQDKADLDADENQEYENKFEATRILEKFPLAMSIAIPQDSELLTESSLLIYLKPRRLYVVQKENMEILEEYELKKMLSWEVDEEKLSFEYKEESTQKSKTHIIYTEYAQLFSEYLREIGQLTRNGK